MILGSGLIQSTWPRASDWLIWDEYTDTVAAGSVNGTAATPGPGTRATSSANVTVGEGQIAVTGTNIWGESSWYHSNAVARVAGVALIQNIEWVAATSDLMAGWRTDQSLDYLGHANVGIQASSGAIKARFASTAASPDLMSFSAGSYLFATVLRSDGRFIFVRISGAWKLIWVDATDSAATLYGGLTNYTNTRVVKCDFSRVIQLPAPFDSDTGLATDTKSGSVAQGTSFVHEADCIIEFTVDAMTVGSGAIRVRFRKFDANNYWYIYIPEAGDLSLYETVAGGTPIQRGLAAGVVTSGHRVVIIAEGTTIKGYSNNTLRWTYSSATNFAVAVAGEIATLNGGAAVSDLITWPRTLGATAATTQAASILNKVSARWTL